MSAVLKLQATMATLPQVELETKHYFSDGMYARVLVMPKGCVVVGKKHLKGHFFIVSKGRVSLAGTEEARIMEAGAVHISTPGEKRAIVAMEDSIIMTVHKTKKRNIDAIERQLIANDTLALFDAGNKLRALQ